ncbi:MAG TPA: TIGR00730 family Rossman fold protein [Gemmataceae bacterium]|nr:TIGR00730 family Rossman fold protein [Gemmataceae bacterium]
MRSVCVFCGSSLGSNPIYRQAAAALGREIAHRHLRLVYGGGNVGLMGVIADAALAIGGEVIGVIPRALGARELAHQGLTELIVVETMHDRKARMADLADGFIALPGGYGTFEEFCEVLTWTQLGIQAKPCALLNVNGYYDPLLALFDRAVAERFLKPKNRALVLTDTTAAGLLHRLAAWVPVPTEKWLDRDQT